MILKFRDPNDHSMHYIDNIEQIDVDKSSFYLEYPENPNKISILDYIPNIVHKTCKEISASAISYVYFTDEKLHPTSSRDYDCKVIGYHVKNDSTHHAIALHIHMDAYICNDDGKTIERV